MNGALVEHLDLCAALAAGSIDPADRPKYAEHLANGCDECEQLLPGYERATVLIAAALPVSAPTPALRDRVLAAVASVHPPQPPPNPRAMPASPPSQHVPPSSYAPRPQPAMSTSPAPPAPLPAPTLVMPLPLDPLRAFRARHRGPAFATPPGRWAALSGGFLFVALAASAVAWFYASQVKRLHQEIASGTEVITRLNEQLQDAKLWGELYTLPETRTATMLSTSRSDVTMRARAIYDARSQHALMVFNGLRAPQGRVYQLWSIEGPRLTSLGVLETDEQGRAIVRVEQAGDPNRLTEFGVSLEHKGGSPNAAGPAGPLVMVGKVEG